MWARVSIWRLAQGWTVGLEYRHYDFGGQTILTFIPAGVSARGLPKHRATLDTVALRVSWKLGRPEPVAKPMK